MREDIDPVQWVGQHAVVALPVPMDASNAGQVREELLSVINGGATTLIADAARARRAGRWSTRLCRSSVVRRSGPERCAVRG